MTARFVQRTTNDPRDESIIPDSTLRVARQCPQCQVTRVQGREEEGHIANGPHTGVHTVRRYVYYDVDPCAQHRDETEKSADFAE